MAIFHSYVKLPEGIIRYPKIMIDHHFIMKWFTTSWLRRISEDIPGNWCGAGMAGCPLLATMLIGQMISQRVCYGIVTLLAISKTDLSLATSNPCSDSYHQSLDIAQYCTSHSNRNEAARFINCVDFSNEKSKLQGFRCEIYRLRRFLLWDSSLLKNACWHISNSTMMLLWCVAVPLSRWLSLQQSTFILQSYCARSLCG